MPCRSISTPSIDDPDVGLYRRYVVAKGSSSPTDNPSHGVEELRKLSGSLTLHIHNLVSVLGQLLLDLLIHVGGLLCLGELSPGSLLSLVVCGTLDLSPLLESVFHCQYIPEILMSCITHLATTSWYFQPTSWLRRPTVQYFLPGFNLSTRSACGTTILLDLSYGGGMPSKTLSLSIAAAPRCVLWGIIPRTVL